MSLLKKLKDKNPMGKVLKVMKSLINGGGLRFMVILKFLQNLTLGNLSQTIITQESPLLKHTLNSIDI